MLSTFSSPSSFLISKSVSIPVPTITAIPANTNGLNVFATTTMSPFCSISDDGNRLFVLSSTNTSTSAPRYSSDGGSSWSASTFSPGLASSANCWGFASSSDGKYILVCTDTNPSYPYKSIDYGATFTQWTSSNFGGLAVTNAKWSAGVSDDGTVWTFGSTGGASMQGIFVCSNGSNTQANDTFTRYFSTNGSIFGCTCSTDGNNLMAINNSGSGYRHLYSLDKGVTWQNSTDTVASSTIQSHPLISNGSNPRMWSITYNGTTQTSNFCDLSVSTTWDLSFGTSQWSSMYSQGVPNVGDTDGSKTLQAMIVMVTAGTGSNLNNAFYTLDRGTTWIRIGTTFSSLTSVKFRNVAFSKNGQYIMLVSNSTNLYKIKFPTTNI